MCARSTNIIDFSDNRDYLDTFERPWHSKTNKNSMAKSMWSIHRVTNQQSSIRMQPTSLTISEKKR